MMVVAASTSATTLALHTRRVLRTGTPPGWLGSGRLSARMMPACSGRGVKTEASGADIEECWNDAGHIRRGAARARASAGCDPAGHQRGLFGSGQGVASGSVWVGCASPRESAGEAEGTERRVRAVARPSTRFQVL